MIQVEPTENLARYIYSKSYYRPSDNTVRHAAFMPPKNRRLSVFRIFGLRENEIWELGDNLRTDQPLLGRADIKAGSVNETGLAVEADDIPHRHANIVGWPDDDSAIRLKALELAEKAHLHLKIQG